MSDADEEHVMAQLWLIERRIPGWSDDEVAAAGLRAKMCVRWYPNMEWVRSFYDRDGARTLCVYRAESEADLRGHAASSGLPCDQVLPIEEVLPDDIGTVESGQASNAPSA